MKRKEIIYAIIVAAGGSLRMGLELPKQLLPFDGSTVLGTAAARFAAHPDVDMTVIVSPKDGSLDARYEEIADGVAAATGCNRDSIVIVHGGNERSDSVKAGLDVAYNDAVKKLGSADAASECIALIHDAARPGVTEDIITRNIEAIATCRGVCTVIPSSDSIRMIYSGNSEYPDSLPLKESITYPIMNTKFVRRERIYRAQTPQTFRLGDILRAHELVIRDGFPVTDDASAADHAGIEVALVEGSTANYKITTIEDIHMATRTGMGYDVHRLVPGRPLILCGTPIPSNLGLDGHSDADVATHALMDALLGAAGLGDIGRHFPDTDDKYKGADSMDLLAQVVGMLGGAVIVNVDITIIAQAPKLAPYMDQMRQNISRVLGVPESAVNVKATTEEGLGFTGRGEGMAAIAVAAIEGSF